MEIPVTSSEQQTKPTLVSTSSGTPAKKLVAILESLIDSGALVSNGAPGNAWRVQALGDEAFKQLAGISSITLRPDRQDKSRAFVEGLHDALGTNRFMDIKCRLDVEAAARANEIRL